MTVPLISHLFGDSWKLHDMEGLVKHGSTHVYINYHGRTAFTKEKSLEQTRQFTLTERNDEGLTPARIKAC